MNVSLNNSSDAESCLILWPAGPCSGHGTCNNGRCVCDPNWTGLNDLVLTTGLDCTNYIPALRIMWTILAVLSVIVLIRHMRYLFHVYLATWLRTKFRVTPHPINNLVHSPGYSPETHPHPHPLPRIQHHIHVARNSSSMLLGTTHTQKSISWWNTMKHINPMMKCRLVSIFCCVCANPMVYYGKLSVLWHWDSLSGSDLDTNFTFSVIGRDVTTTLGFTLNMTGMWFVPFLLTHTYIKIAHQHASAVGSSSQLPSLHLINQFWVVSFLCRVMTCIVLFIPMMQTYDNPRQAYHKSDILNMMYHLTGVVTHIIMFAGARIARAILPTLSSSVEHLREQAHTSPLAAGKANTLMEVHKTTSHIIKGFINYNLVSVIRELFFACWPYLRAKGTWYITSFYMIVMITAITTFKNLDESMLAQIQPSSSTVVSPKFPSHRHYQVTPTAAAAKHKPRASDPDPAEWTPHESSPMDGTPVSQLRPHLDPHPHAHQGSTSAVDPSSCDSGFQLTHDKRWSIDTVESMT